MTIFHRKYNQRTQSVRTALHQSRSKELWGSGAFGGLPAALAYFDSLPDSQEGTQFTCDVPYAKNGDPAWAYWYTPEHGGDAKVTVKERDHKTFACVPIEPTVNRYRCRSKR